jgi:hypothetical protein
MIKEQLLTLLQFFIENLSGMVVSLKACAEKQKGNKNKVDKRVFFIIKALILIK